MLARRCAVACVAAALGVAALATTDAHAQNLEPREYANTPVGLNFALLGYGYLSGNVVADPSIPLKDGEVQSHSVLLAYVRSLDVWGTSAKLGVVLPWTTAHGTAIFQGQSRERDVSGLGDPRFIFSVNLYGAPALTLEQFPAYKQDTIFGVSLAVTAPLGQYDPDKFLNIGTNRWSIRPELGISKAVGTFTLELAAGVTFFTKNGEFLGQSLEQAPLYAVQGHVLHDLARGVWGAVDVVYYRGGRTTIDGVEGDDLQESVRVGGTLAVSLSRYQSIKLYGSTTVYSRTGSRFNLIGAAWQYRWGAGL